MPQLRIRRDRRWADKLGRYEILLDGRSLGLLAEGATLCQEITPGPHIIQARINWCGSEGLHFEATGDVDFSVKNAHAGWRILLAAFYAVFDPGRYLTIEPANPPLQADDHLGRSASSVARR
jgi:hypothetical protein